MTVLNDIHRDFTNSAVAAHCMNVVIEGCPPPKANAEIRLCHVKQGRRFNSPASPYPLCSWSPWTHPVEVSQLLELDLTDPPELNFKYCLWCYNNHRLRFVLEKLAFCAQIFNNIAVNNDFKLKYLFPPLHAKTEVLLNLPLFLCQHPYPETYPPKNAPIWQPLPY